MNMNHKTIELLERRRLLTLEIADELKRMGQENEARAIRSIANNEDLELFDSFYCEECECVIPEDKCGSRWGVYCGNCEQEIWEDQHDILEGR